MVLLAPTSGRIGSNNLPGLSPDVHCFQRAGSSRTLNGASHKLQREIITALFVSRYCQGKRPRHRVSQPPHQIIRHRSHSLNQDGGGPMSGSLPFIERCSLVLILQGPASRLVGGLTVPGDVSVARANAGEFDELVVEPPHQPSMADKAEVSACYWTFNTRRRIPNGTGESERMSIARIARSVP